MLIGCGSKQRVRWVQEGKAVRKAGEAENQNGNDGGCEPTEKPASGECNKLQGWLDNLRSTKSQETNSQYNKNTMA